MLSASQEIISKNREEIKLPETQKPIYGLWYHKTPANNGDAEFEPKNQAQYFSCLCILSVLTWHLNYLCSEK